MSSPLHMLRMGIDPQALVRFTQTQGLNHSHDEDLGYATHAWFAACFGELAPKPFRILDSSKPCLTLLAYSESSSADLAEHAAVFATPGARQVLDPRTLAHVRMPERWREGVRLGFELLTCPITRQGQSEKDVFLRRLERQPPGTPPPERSAVYREWLAAQLEGAAALENFHLEGFRLTRVLRRTQLTAQVRTRSAQFITRPRALCRGMLTVRDGDRFQELLKRGIGRHRAFGYGMLLLHPSV
jgi:CRISPR system Cascade subunit CasE